LDDADREESLEQQSLELRFKYAARFEKLLRRPQAEDVFDLLRIYADRCLPIPRKTERFYWSVSCLPSTNDKPLVRVNASWMELFTLLPDGDGLRSRISFTLPTSPRTAHPTRTSSTKTSSKAASSSLRTSLIPCGGGRKS